MLSLPLVTTLAACTFVKPFRQDVEVKQKNQAETDFSLAASQQHKDVMESIAALKYITEPISKKANDSSGGITTEESTLGLVDIDTQKVTLNAFALTYEIFREISVGNMSAKGGSSGEVIQEFESLRSSQLTNGAARTIIRVRGDLNGTHGGEMTKGMDLVIVTAQGKRTVYPLLENADIKKGLSGFSLNLDHLYSFLADFSKLSKRNADIENLGGQISVTREEDNSYHLISSDFHWGNVFAIQLTNLDLTRKPDGGFLSLDVSGQIRRGTKNMQLKVSLTSGAIPDIDIKNTDTK